MRKLPAKPDIKLGTSVPEWGSDRTKRTFTFVLTQDCNLACGYCYMTGKNKDSRMTWDVASKAIDYILSQDFPEECAIFDFIGGEPFLELELMDQIIDHIQIELYRRNHKWKNDYRFSLSSNGVLYCTPAVQNFVKKHLNHLSVGITIDGTKRKHDLQRKFRDGRGSYDVVAESVRLWLQHFPEAGTKVTFSSDDLPYLKESIIHLWELGLKHIPANCVFEDVWKEGDDKILEEQLKALADYALDHDLERTHICTFFHESCGMPSTDEDLKRNWCGGGSCMMSIDHNGIIYPCIRFMGYSLNNHEPIVLGDIYNGVDWDRVRPFQTLTIPSQSAPQCPTCEVATQCAWCQGNNYDSSPSGTIFHRPLFSCLMHKARVRANDYFQARVARKYGVPMANQRGKTLFFILSDDSVPVCGYHNRPGSLVRMPEDVFRKGQQWAAENFFYSMLLQPQNGPHYELPGGVLGGNATLAIQNPPFFSDLLVYENSVPEAQETACALLVLDKEYLPQLADLVIKLLPVTSRTILALRDTHSYTDSDRDLYNQQLEIIQPFVATYGTEFSALTDSLFLDRLDTCMAGTNSFALGPNGLLYICPAFYYSDPDSAVGSLETGIDPMKVAMCELKRAPLCSSCSAYHCKRCLFDNQRFTGEINTPPRSQCLISHVELRQSAVLRDRVAAEKPDGKIRPAFSVPFLDPLEAKPAGR